MKKNSMPAGKAVQVLADRTGKIIGAVLLDESEALGEMRACVVALDGQRLVKIKHTPELGKLESAADFQRLIADFHLPRGRTALARKPAKLPKKRRSIARVRRR